MTDDNEEFRGRMSAEIEHFYDRLGEIETQLLELRSLLAARLDAHDRYHHENEHQWGMIAWCHRYPFRLLTLAASLAVALIGELRDPILSWLLDLLHKIGG